MLALGKDVLGLILRECDAVSVCRLRRACHRLNALGGTESLWAFLLKRDYGVTDPFGSLEAYKDEWVAEFEHRRNAKETFVNARRKAGHAGVRCYLRRSTENILSLMSLSGQWTESLCELVTKYCNDFTGAWPRTGMTPLHMAMDEYDDDRLFVPFLLEAGVDPNLLDKRGRTPLDLYFRDHVRFGFCGRTKQENLRLMLERGAKFTKKVIVKCPRCLEIVKEAQTK